MTITGDLLAVQQRIEQLEGLGADGETFSALVRRADPATGDRARELPGESGIDGLIVSAAHASELDPALVKAIVANESGFNPRATSPTGAQGLMQLEPETAASLGVHNPYDPAENLSGGTRYIRGLLERFKGNIQLAVAAYNAGPGAVAKYGGIPPYAETRTYVENVLQSYNRYKRQAR